MTNIDITVCTTSHPERFQFREEVTRSVAAQTLRPYLHLIGIDWELRGGQSVINDLVMGAPTEWIAVFADDDLMYPNHLEALASGVSDDVHAVYTWCDVTGRVKLPNWNPSSRYDPNRLRNAPYIPSNILLRKQSIIDCGMFITTGAEDWDMQVKIINKFGDQAIKCVPKTTWQYRFHQREDGSPGNVSDGWIARETTLEI